MALNLLAVEFNATARDFILDGHGQRAFATQPCPMQAISWRAPHLAPQPPRHAPLPAIQHGGRTVRTAARRHAAHGRDAPQQFDHHIRRDHGSDGRDGCGDRSGDRDGSTGARRARGAAGDGAGCSAANAPVRSCQSKPSFDSSRSIAATVATARHHGPDHRAALRASAAAWPAARARWGKRARGHDALRTRRRKSGMSGMSYGEVAALTAALRLLD